MIKAIKNFFNKIFKIVFWPFTALLRAIKKNKHKNTMETFFANVERLKALRIDFDATYEDDFQKLKASRKIK